MDKETAKNHSGYFELLKRKVRNTNIGKNITFLSWAPMIVARRQPKNKALYFDSWTLCKFSIFLPLDGEQTLKCPCACQSLYGKS